MLKFILRRRLEAIPGRCLFLLPSLYDAPRAGSPLPASAHCRRKCWPILKQKISSERSHHDAVQFQLPEAAGAWRFLDHRLNIKITRSTHLLPPASRFGEISGAAALLAVITGVSAGVIAALKAKYAMGIIR